MKATEANLLEFFKKSSQFLIPIYQRTYSWEQKECNQLWDDIIRTGRNDKISAHFVGSIVYVEKGLYQVSSQSPVLVIDGQQRLTTITLLIEAMARRLGNSEPVDGFSAKKLRNYYLLNSLEDGEKRYKLVLSQTDKASLITILDQQQTPKEFSVRVEENFGFFRDKLAASEDEIVAICKGLAKLVIVDISLSRDQDNPQLIFESLNSTGRELSQADLIRNFILMGLEPKRQNQLYEKFWRPMEVDFGQDAYATHFDGFMRHYLTVKTGDIPNVREVYDAFKTYSRLENVGAVEDIVQDLRKYAGYYCAMALGTEPDTELKLVFHDIRELKVDVAYPFLLELYHDYVQNSLSRDEFLEAARLVESFVFRRAVCGIPTNTLNKIFPNFARGLKKEKYLESIKANFLLLLSYRRFPSDDEFQRELKHKDLYNFPRRSYWLRRIENHGRKERVSVAEYTVEHILPQNENLSKQWREELGDDWERIQQTYLHTIGNLTLTGYNSEYGDKPFTEKQKMKGGFAESPLQLNKELGSVSKWNEDAITQRAERLSQLAIDTWPMPKLDPDVFYAYKPKVSSSGYTIYDHPYLASGAVRTLFDAFRREVLALDPSVTEEFMKAYVAYKAETNFVDVIPLAKRLRLILNMSIAEISDPKSLCKDISHVGHGGNGGVEIGLSSLAELPYIIGLVRQSLELQMDDGNDGD